MVKNAKTWVNVPLSRIVQRVAVLRSEAALRTLARRAWNWSPVGLFFSLTDLVLDKYCWGPVGSPTCKYQGPIYD
jgi:hypothetical protein